MSYGLPELLAVLMKLIALQLRHLLMNSRWWLYFVVVAIAGGSVLCILCASTEEYRTPDAVFAGGCHLV